MTAPVMGDLGFSYEFGIDIDLNYPTIPDTPNWAQVAFITGAGDTNEKVKVDTATYYDKGAARQAITGESWGLAFTHQLQRKSDGTYIDVLAKLVKASSFGQRNLNAKVRVRFYDTAGADYAYQGEAYCSRARASTANAEVGGFTFTLEGDGALTAITNPNLVAGKPTILTVLPAVGTVGTPIKITGTKFSTVAATGGVKFGAVTALYIVDDASTIYATMPAGSAGPANVTVINPTGTSDPFTYTRGA